MTCLDPEWLALLERVRCVGHLPESRLPDPEMFGAMLGRVTLRLVESGGYELADLLMEFAEAFPQPRRAIVVAQVPEMVVGIETALAVNRLRRESAVRVGVHPPVFDASKRKQRGVS